MFFLFFVYSLVLVHILYFAFCFIFIYSFFLFPFLFFYYSLMILYLFSFSFCFSLFITQYYFVIHHSPDKLDCVFSYRFNLHKEICGDLPNQFLVFLCLLPFCFIFPLIIIVAVSILTIIESIVCYRFETTIQILQIFEKEIRQNCPIIINRNEFLFN